MNQIIQNKKSLKELRLETRDDGKIKQNESNLNKVIDGLNSVSSSLCLAKFTQVTMHLGSGLVHSCHHPTPHKIPLDELEKNPAALFNTTILKVARKEMLNSIKPKECEYCWRIENNKNRSDRHLKSREDWAINEYDNIVNSSGEEFFKPTYLEVSFGNACNLKCVYCGPEFSSKWVEELKSQGPIKITDGNGKEQWVQGWQDLDSISIPNREHNPYIEAFWKWFPEIYPGLKHYRITGGEPLLNKNTLKSLDYLIENPKQDLELSINSNLSVPEKIWQDFLNKVIKLEKSANFKKITIYTSFESWGNRAEYARTELDFNLVKNRFEELLEKTSVRCVVMATYNVLAITSFVDVLKWILHLKQQYNFNPKRELVYSETNYDLKTNKAIKSSNSFRVGIDIPYLRHPEFLDVQYCNDDLLLNYMLPCLEFMIDNTSDNPWKAHLSFEKYELEKFQRIVENRLHFKGHNNKNIMQAKFFDFINAIDTRRNLNFLEVFPEMENWYNNCKQSKEIISTK
jgi:organic radical activating enzyme